MTEFLIDGNTVTSISIFHDIVSVQGRFPSYYGRNFDAFWDCLTTDVEGPINFIWRNHEHSKKCLGRDFNKIINLLKKAVVDRGDMNLDLC